MIDEKKLEWAKKETGKHIKNVSLLIDHVIHDLCWRQADHDRSKLEETESEGFAEVTDLLKGLTYGSDEYKETLVHMKPFLDHHYENNDHHPEHFENGVTDMNLMQIIEMLCDWKAATLRHANGDIMKSIDINTKRFGMSEQLAQILRNTVPYLEQIEKELEHGN